MDYVRQAWRVKREKHMRFVVIGASRGLGFALTQRMLKDGHQVVATTRAASPPLDALSGEFPGQLLVLTCDATDEAATQEAARKAGEFLGPIDAVCHNAGVLLQSDRTLKLHESNLADLRATLDINVVGPVITVQSFLPYMAAGGRFFVVTSEGVGITSCGSWVPAYALSKAAATKACGILNASVKGHDFYAVHPGRMDTDMGRTTAQIQPEETAEGMLKLMTGQVPLSRDHWYIDYHGVPMQA